MYAQTYQSLKDADKMYASAQEILKIDPKNVQGLYYVTSLAMGKTDAPRLADGEKAASALITEVSALKKPDAMAEADWNKQRDGLLVLANKTLGWIAMTRKNNAEAEKYFREVLQLDPQNGQISYWLGAVMLAQRDPDKQIKAFYHFARSSAYTGDGAMTDDGRKEADTYLRKIYTSFHGDDSGLDEIFTMAKSDPFPPSGFTIKSKEQIAVEEDEAFRKSDPKLYMWMNVKKQLTAPNGTEYFDSQVRNTAMPSMRGYLIAQSPAERPDTLVLGISDRGTREVTLKLDTAYRYPAGRGTVLNFQCVPQSFSQSPFNIEFSCEASDVSGWPPPPSRQTTRQ
jgi:tetratricopeptide (TPR) repeat protein